jgi:hypothetical protein
MTISFGIHARPSAITWNEICKGPPAEAVREHLARVVAFRQYYEAASGSRVK